MGKNTVGIKTWSLVAVIEVLLKCQVYVQGSDVGVLLFSWMIKSYNYLVWMH